MSKPRILVLAAAGRTGMPVLPAAASTRILGLLMG